MNVDYFNMPHLVILYTPNLEAKTDMSALCRALADTMIEQLDEEGKQVFPTGGTRVLASPAAHNAVAADGGATLRQNGVVEETGLAACVQGHPAIGVAWLAAKLSEWGECLDAGEVVLAGSFTRPALAKAGDVFDANYGPLGRFQFRFI